MLCMLNSRKLAKKDSYGLRDFVMCPPFAAGMLQVPDCVYFLWSPPLTPLISPQQAVCAHLTCWNVWWALLTTSPSSSVSSSSCYWGPTSPPTARPMHAATTLAAPQSQASCPPPPALASPLPLAAPRRPLQTHPSRACLEGTNCQGAAAVCLL